MGHRKLCYLLSLFTICVLIQTIQTAGVEWNKECYSKNDCYKLLENGKKITWSEAYEFCQKEKGYLINETWIESRRITGSLKLVWRLVKNTDTWTSLHLVDDYMKEITKHTSYAHSSNKFSEKFPVFNEDSCIRLTAQNKLEATKCTVKLPAICTSDLNKIKEKDCDHHLDPILTAEVSGRSVNVQDGHFEINERHRGNLTFNCGGLERRSRIQWVKDGTYLRIRENKIQPANISDPTKCNDGYSMQGTYWCETWRPGCTNKFSSNKVNLIFEGLISIHLNLQGNKHSVLNYTEAIEKVNRKFLSCGTKRRIDCDIKRDYANVENNIIPTYNFNMYIPKTCDVYQYISEIRRQLSSIGIVEIGISFLPLQNGNRRLKRQSAVRTCDGNTNQNCMACPRHFTLQNPYCVRISRPANWNEAYQDCFRTGIEKTPLDIKSFWMNATLLNNLVDSLNRENASYIWLAAERKFDGGPLYYSGPVKSDFNYNFTEIDAYNISWLESDFSVNDKCLALNIAQKKLQVLSCEDALRFVCLFPSEFWTQNTTYDNFHKCNGNCSEGYDDHGGIPWMDARENCRKISPSDLVDTDNKAYINHIDISPHSVKFFYAGKHNSEISDSDSPLHYKFTQWIEAFKNESEKSYSDSPLHRNFTHKLYVLNNKQQLLTQSNNELKKYACLDGQKRTRPRLKLVGNKGNYTIKLFDVEEVSYVYGIKCYLNGILMKANEILVIIAIREGSLFCEALTHFPVFLLKSDITHVQHPRIITFACQIFDPNQTYNFKLHDLSFHNESVGSILYYKRLLNEKFKEFNISIYSVSNHTTGININFHIEISSEEDKLKQLYQNISTSLLPIGGEIKLETRTLTVSYVRNTKYCMEETYTVEPYTSNCTTTATWPVTAIGGKSSTLEGCVTCENKILKRSCRGNFITGALWGEIRNHLSKVIQCNSSVLQAAKDLISQTITSISHVQTVDKFDITNRFIRNFETLLIGKEVNGSYKTENETVGIFSTFIQSDTVGYTYNGEGKVPEIKATKIEKLAEDITVAIYLTPKFTAQYEKKIPIIIAVFIKNAVFPKRTKNYIRISPVAHINVTDGINITYPFKILFHSEGEIELHLQPICAFWDEKTNEWDENDSEYNGTIYGLHECLFNHLSSFSMILRADDDDATLDIISKVGCYLSLIGLSLVLLTFLVFRKWRSYLDSKIVASLSLSLFVMYLVFVTGFTHTSKKFVCIGTAVILHYFILASFCWMLVEAFHIYLKFVKVIGTYIPRFMWKASACAWGVPLVPVIAVLCYDYELYRDDKYCWVHGEAFLYALLIPLGTICGANMLIFFVIVISTTSTRQRFRTNQQQYSLLVSQLKISFCVFVLLGLSWVFGFIRLSGAGIVFSYLFSVISTLQGFLIFIFFVLQERRAKGMWQTLFYKCFGAQPQILQDTRAVRTQTTNLESSL